MIPQLAEIKTLEALARSENTNPKFVGLLDVLRQCAAILNTEKSGKDNRTKKCNRLLNYYNDFQYQHFMQDVLLPMLGGQVEYDKMPVKPVIKISNIITRTIDRLGTLYDEPPSRRIMTKPTASAKPVQAAGKGNEEATATAAAYTENQAASTLYKDILEKSGANVYLQKLERYQILFKAGFIRPQWNEEENKVEFVLLLPTLLYCLPEEHDATKVKAYFWAEKYSESFEGRYWYIDKDRFFGFEFKKNDGRTANSLEISGVSVTILTTEEAKEEGAVASATIENTLEQIDIIRAPRTVLGQVIENPGDTDISTQDNINLKKTLETNSLVFSGFPVLKMVGFGQRNADGSVRTVKISPWGVLAAEVSPGEEAPTADWLIPQTNVGEFQLSINSDLDFYFASKGINKNSVLDTAQSGAALQERNREVREIRKGQIPIFKEVEQDLYGIIAKLHNSYSGSKETLPEEALCIPDFVEPEDATMTPKEELEVWEKKFSLGVASPIDYFINENPDLDEEAATQKLRKIKTANDLVKSLLGGSIREAMDNAIKPKAPVAPQEASGGVRKAPEATPATAPAAAGSK